MFENISEQQYLLKQLVKRDLTSKYKDSIFGILWSFINPLLIMLVFTAIFSMLFRFQIENFPVYFLTGRLLFDFFKAGTSGAMYSVKSNASILKKIFVPRYMFAMSSIAYEFINFLISLTILIGIMYITGATFYLTSLYAIIPIFFLILLIIGAGLILAVLNTYFSDIGHLYGIFTLVLMYASALFYPMEIVPANIQAIFTLNPVYSAISCFRDSIMYGIFPEISTLMYLAIFSITVLGIGILLFEIYEKKLVLKL